MSPNPALASAALPRRLWVVGCLLLVLAGLGLGGLAGRRAAATAARRAVEATGTVLAGQQAAAFATATAATGQLYAAAIAATQTIAPLPTVGAARTALAADRVRLRVETLIAEADSAAARDPELGVLLAMEAVSMTMRLGEPPLPQAEAGLHRALARPWPSLALTPNPPTGVPLLALARSPGGTSLLTAHRDGRIRAWDLATGLVWRTWQVAPGSLAVAWQPDEQTVVALGADGVFTAWVVTTGQVRWQLRGGPAAVPGLAWAPDGSALAATGGALPRTGGDEAGGPVVLTPDGGVRRQLRGHRGPVRGITWSRDGRWLITAGADGTARWWDAATGAPTTVLTATTGLQVALLDPSQTRLLTVDDAGTVQLWASATGQEVGRLPGRTGGRIAVAAWRPDGTGFATGDDAGTVRIWAADGTHEVALLRAHQGAIRSLSWGEGNTLLTAGVDGSVRVWPLDDRRELPPARPAGRTLLPWETTLGEFAAVQYSPDGTWFATEGVDGGLRLWVAAQPTGAGLALPGTCCLSWRPDGQEIAAGGDAGQVRVWSLAAVHAGLTAPRLTLTGLSKEPLAVAYSPDGRRLAASSDGGLAAIWDTQTGATLATLVGHSGRVSALAWAPDGQRLATLGWDNSARIWDGQTGVPLAVLRGHFDIGRAVAWSPDGTRLLTAADDGTARLWDAASGRELVTLPGDDAVFAAIWMPDGGTVLTAGASGDVRLWSTVPGGATPTPTPLAIWKGTGHRFWSLAVRPDGQEIAAGDEGVGATVWDRATGAVRAVIYHRDWVTALAYRADGCRLLTGSADGTAQQVITCPTDLLTAAATYAGRDLTPAERARYGVEGP